MHIAHHRPLIQASIRETACWFNFECLLQSQNPELVGLDPNNLTDTQTEQLEAMLLALTQVCLKKHSTFATASFSQTNTDAINTAKDNLQFTTTDQLAQGATTLEAITANVAGTGILSNTLDMNGREAAVEMISVRNGLIMTRRLRSITCCCCFCCRKWLRASRALRTRTRPSWRRSSRA